ncbi:hypothetical protein, partial [Solemya velum gill symbiont]|uniref:hypothetical protein n=4 Tax=Solemya velum gill symbiont TaxID=2340 RepID=UPI0009CA9F86
MTTADAFLDKSLALFQNPQTDPGSQGTEWVTYRPVNQLTGGSAIEFTIPPMANTYLDLQRTLLNLKVKITKSDGSDVGSLTDDLVGLVNAPLHTLFSQVDLNVQQQPTSEVGSCYPYKAYLDVLLNTEDEVELYSQLFSKDTGDLDDTDAAGGTNLGLIARAFYTKDGKNVELLGRLQLDLCQQDRWLLNGLPIHLKLWQTRDAFRLLTKDESTQYKMKIEDASLRVATVKIDPGVIVAHEDALKKGNDALYPFAKSIVKTYAVPQGQFAFYVDDLFQGRVPHRLIVGLVSSNAVNGTYTKNPFNFEPFDCNKVGFYVDGQSVPSQPLQPNYSAEQYTEAYDTLKKAGGRAVDIWRLNYKRGYCLYVIEPFGVYRPHGPSRKGHTRLELNFGTALPETVTVVVYAKFPALMRV